MPRRGLSRVAALLPLLALLLVPGTAVAAAAATPTPDDAEARIILFHGEGCPHCATEIEYLDEEFIPSHPDVSVYAFEVWNDAENRDLMVQAGEAYGFEPGAVPTTIIEGPAGFEVVVGFGAGSGELIEAALERVTTQEPTGQDEADDEVTTTSVVEVPLLGEVDLADSSMLVATVVIGFVDGVNPCSLWVLSMLLAIVLHSGSRGRVLLVGGVFLTVTAGMYAVYIAGVYSVLTVLESMVWIRVVVALVAFVFGVLQLKDGLRPGRGPSLSISAERRPGLYQRMRAVSVGERGVLATIAGTVVLAVGVSLLETPCTAGLPLLWANLLAQNDVATAKAIALFGVYMAVFLVEELLVFGVALVTLRSMKLQERQGRALKIVAGSVLVTLAAAMLLAPDAMQTVTGTLSVFGIALVLGLAVWVLSRRMDQDRTQRVSSVPSADRASEANERDSGG